MTCQRAHPDLAGRAAEIARPVDNGTRRPWGSDGQGSPTGPRAVQMVTCPKCNTFLPNYSHEGEKCRQRHLL